MRRTPWVLVATCAFLGSLTGAALAPTFARVRAAETGAIDWAETDVQVSNPHTLFPGDQKILYEPTIAIDPTNPKRMIAFAIDLSPQNVDASYYYSTNRAYRSTDGGRTWKDMGPIPYSADKQAWDGGDPVALFDSKGTAYFASLARPPDDPGGIYVHRSVNAGRSWLPPVRAVASIRNEDEDACTGTDKEWLSLDPRTGKLYLAYTLFSYTCSGLGDPLGADTFTRLTDLGIYLTTSDDRGRTWTESSKLWDGYALGAIPKAAPDGTLFMTFWAAVADSPSPCPSAAGTATVKADGRPFATIVTGSSKDEGATWDWEQHALCDFLPGEATKSGRFVGGRSLPTMSLDPSRGAAYVAWPEFDPLQRRFTVMFRSSTDGGSTWSDPAELTPGAEDAQNPAIFASDGVIRLVYVTSTGIKDQQPETVDGTADTWYIESADGGATWSEPFRLSTETGQLKENTEVGDYIGIDVAAGHIATIWTDARDVDVGQIWSRVGTLPQARRVAPIATSSPPARPVSPAILGVTPRFAPPHRMTAGGAPVSAGSRASCGDLTGLERALRANPEPRSFRVWCSLDHALSAVLDAATGRVLFTELDASDGEVLFARERRLVLVKMIAGRDATRGTVHVVD